MRYASPPAPKEGAPVYCAFWADYYDCQDNFLSRHWNWCYQYFWSWNPRIRKWELIGSYGSPIEHYSDIDWSLQYSKIPRTQDKRSRLMQQKGCCPSGLSEVAYQFYSYQETLFHRFRWGDWTR